MLGGNPRRRGRASMPIFKKQNTTQVILTHISLPLSANKLGAVMVEKRRVLRTMMETGTTGLSSKLNLMVEGGKDRV